MRKSAIAKKKGKKPQQVGNLTTADLVVLSLLAERAMHGYELLGEYDRQEVADWASVSKAQVYYALRKLEEMKLIALQDNGEPDGERARSVYRPTDAGQSELVRALSDEAWANLRVAQPFATWLGLSVHLPPDKRNQVLMARKRYLTAEHDKEVASLAFIKTLPSERARVGEAIVTLVIAQIDVELQWLETMIGGS